jgi:hypothetical protein
MPKIYEREKNRIVCATSRGQTLIDTLLGLAVFAALVTVLGSFVLEGYIASRQGNERTKAGFLAEEGIEASRAIRDRNAAELTAGEYGLSLAGSQWVFSGTSDAVDKFVRRITVEDAGSRRRRITSDVSWPFSPARLNRINAATFLHDWISAVAGNWATPSLSFSRDAAGIQNGLKLKVSENYLYLVRDGGSPNFLIYNISNPLFPPVPQGFLTLPGRPTDIAVSGTYAFVASRHNAQELQVVNVANPLGPFLEGALNLPGGADALGIAVSGSFLSIVRAAGGGAPQFAVVNVSAPSFPVSAGSLPLGATAYDVAVYGNFAFVASAHDSQELQVVNISVPGSPSLAGSLNLAGIADARAVAAFGPQAVIGRSDGGIHVINIGNPSAPLQDGVLDYGDAVNDLSFGNGYAYVFAASDENTAEVQIIDISLPQTPSLVGVYNAAADVNGVVYEEGFDRAFLATDSDSAELIVLRPL